MNKKGFTLIELLAVIIILGILMIIAIPSVTKYISDSRKSAYIDTAKEIIGGARNFVNEGKIGMYDTNTTYYIPSSCIQTENATKSNYDGKGYKYYWVSVDDAGQAVKENTSYDKLDPDLIASDVTKEEIEDIIDTTAIGKRDNIKVLGADCKSWERERVATNHSNLVSKEANINVRTTMFDAPSINIGDEFENYVILNEPNYTLDDLTCKWYYSVDNGASWLDYDIAGNASSMTYVLSDDNWYWMWKVSCDLIVEE